MEFFDFNEHKSSVSFPNKQNPNIIFENEFVLSEFGMNHERIAYNLIDVLSDIAGMFELIKAVLGVVIYKVSEHSFLLKTLNRLFLISTRYPHLFRK